MSVDNSQSCNFLLWNKITVDIIKNLCIKQSDFMLNIEILLNTTHTHASMHDHTRASMHDHTRASMHDHTRASMKILWKRQLAPCWTDANCYHYHDNHDDQTDLFWFRCSGNFQFFSPRGGGSGFTDAIPILKKNWVNGSAEQQQVRTKYQHFCQ